MMCDVAREDLTIAVSQREFEAIVRDVAEFEYRLHSVEGRGFDVYTKFWARSRKRIWRGELRFDAETGQFSSYSEEPEALQVQGLGRAIRERIHHLLAAQSSTSYYPQIGEVSRVRGGRTPWVVQSIGSAFVRLVSEESSRSRSEPMSNLEPWDR